MAFICSPLKNYNTALWCVRGIIVAWKSNSTFDLYCCWHTCICQQCKSIHCYDGNTRTTSICTV